ncbi:MAG: spore coat biosynthesis protein F [Methanomicrobiales archaeon HGW-Methanomicrobiales-1]|jgi:spore coat polysaccharide biosynthesis protein SpsF|nr:MAG: spore coat biosynthesis protein F [Methanomicrobiales archaeon HGW-Methanomicrobiales-1]
MKIVATIEARMTSNRLPGKILRPILGKPTLELLIERLAHVRQIDQIVVATTSNRTDDVVEELACRLGIGCYRGSEDDVLDRVIKAAQSYDADIIVEITGDCPLLDPKVIDHLIEIFLHNSYDYVSNTLKQTYPNGLDAQVFSLKTLEEVASLTLDPVDHEHVSLYIYEHPERYTLFNLESGLPEKYWDLRLTVDTIEDFGLINSIYEELYPKNPRFTLEDILDLLDKKPDLININKQIQQKKVH